MKMGKQACILFLLVGLHACSSRQNAAEETYLQYVVDPKAQLLQLYWKDEQGNPLQTFARLENYLARAGKTLKFAMNAGMFKPDFSPQGLFIENGQTIVPLDTARGEGNFYLQPNGIFYLTTDNQAVVCTTNDFVPSENIRDATQSGPMLVINGSIHPAFNANSPNVHIRNGVGILPDGKVVFVLSKKAVNLYDFAQYFQRLGCQNALYLDGFVSRAYWPEKGWVQTDDRFGVMIGVTNWDN